MAANRTTVSARERLLEAADELFYARGIAATGVDAVLQRAGASPATLYAHFSGKEGLVAAYLERRHHRWRGTWDAVLDEVDDPIDRLLSVLDALARFRQREGATRGCAVLAAAAELPVADHPARAWIEADTTLLHQRLHELALAAGIDEPHALVSELVLIYDGTLASYARAATDPMPTARELARGAVRRHSAPRCSPQAEGAVVRRSRACTASLDVASFTGSAGTAVGADEDFAAEGLETES